MAELVERQREIDWGAPRRRDQRGGRYSAYVPDPLLTQPVVVDAALARLAARVEVEVRGLGDATGSTGLESLSRFLLRSEAIASSRIEGLQASAQQVALAEWAVVEDVRIAGLTENGRLVANNIVALRQASGALGAVEEVTADDICELHHALLPDHREQGLRTMQNWIGGSDWHPLDADFVPPPPELVRPLMDDLAAYLSGALHAPLIQAALVHAQFETIHPFADGNGRVGRALIHTVLTRRGLTRGAVLPISLVLLTRSQEYVDGLMTFRHRAAAGSPEAVAAVNGWLEMFLNAARTAVQQAATFVADLEELRADWQQRYAAYRATRGFHRPPRADAAVMRLMPLLSEVPVTTVQSVQRLLDISDPAARAALEELADAGILHRKSIDRGATAFLAREVFDLLTLIERRLASTQWDTRESTPRRPTPARPQH
jgi:Fic family protein